MSQEYSEQIETYKTFERVQTQDSVIENLYIPESPKFLVLDENGKLRYIFQDFPYKGSSNRPIDPRIIAIFEILK